MALATQCPHCGTTFRVAHDQLKLRAGLVRCGACKEIFNGIEHLLPAAERTPADAAEPDIPLPPSPLATNPGTAADSAVPPHAITVGDSDSDSDADADEDEATEPTAAALSQAPEANPAAPESRAYDPLQRMTLMDFAWDEKAAQGRAGQAADADDDENPGGDHEADELERVIDDLQRRPLRRSSVEPEIEAFEEPEEVHEPDFLARARKRQHGDQTRRVLLGAAVCVLLLGVLAQGAYAFRSQLAAHFPETKPLLVAACEALGCRIDLPKQIDSVTIESSELQMLAPDQHTFALSVLLRNRSATVEAWPHIELTLNDASEQPLVRRVFLPREYLPAAHSEGKGFAANSEQPLRIYFELATLKAAGYRVYLFYS